MEYQYSELLACCLYSYTLFVLYDILKLLKLHPIYLL
jgi:hypothetical protein